MILVARLVCSKHHSLEGTDTLDAQGTRHPAGSAGTRPLPELPVMDLPDTAQVPSLVQVLSPVVASRPSLEWPALGEPAATWQPGHSAYGLLCAPCAPHPGLSANS